MSKLSTNLQSGKFTITCELNPPKGINLEKLFNKADMLKERVVAINITDSEIEIPGTAIRNSLGDDADGMYDIIVQKIDNGYSFPSFHLIVSDVFTVDRVRNE